MDEAGHVVETFRIIICLSAGESKTIDIVVGVVVGVAVIVIVTIVIVVIIACQGSIKGI